MVNFSDTVHHGVVSSWQSTLYVCEMEQEYLNPNAHPTWQGTPIWSKKHPRKQIIINFIGILVKGWLINKTCNLSFRHVLFFHSTTGHNTLVNLLCSSNYHISWFISALGVEVMTNFSNAYISKTKHFWTILIRHYTRLTFFWLFWCVTQ